MLHLILGIALIAFAVISFIVCVCRTPDNLQGFYGAMYGVIALGSIVGGILLIMSGYNILG